MNSIIKKATHERNRLKGFKADNTKKLKAGAISVEEAKTIGDHLDKSSNVLTAYINYNKDLLETFQKKGSGILRKHRGGNVMFYNDVTQLLKKLELIIGSVNAGNSSIQMRNTGVAILDMLLKMATINRSQYNKLYNQYFKV